MNDDIFDFTLRLRKPSLARLGVWLPSRGNVLFTLVMIGVLLWAQSAGAVPFRAESAASTGTIAYQGRLADSSGNPLTSTLPMSFRLYSAVTGGAPLWSEQWTGPNGVKVSDGLFNVMLGSLTPIAQSVITGNSTLFLGITIGTADEMAPRVQLGSVPFAVQALTVPDGSITTAKIADGSVTADKLSVSLFNLLGEKTCSDCGNPIEQSVGDWKSVKGQNVNDVIEISVTTEGGPVLVQMTAGFLTDPGIGHFCGIEVRQDNSRVRFVHLDGSRIATTDFSCSGEWLFPDLSAGTYIFRAMGHAGGTAQVTWIRQRQIVVYELLSRTPAQ